MEGNSLRDQMKDMIRGYVFESNLTVDYDHICNLADVIFEVMMVDEDSQDRPYKEYQESRRLIQKAVEEDENISCVKCGRRDLPLHYNRQCPECFIPEEGENE